MGKTKKTKNQDHQGVKRMRQFHLMQRKLHQMLQSLGQESVGDGLIKLDQFQKLRRAFTSSAQTYQSCNKQIKNISDRVARAQFMFKIMESKRVMEQALKQMTALCVKLKQKITKQQVKQVKQVKQGDKYKTPSKKKRQFQETEQIIMSDEVQQQKKQSNQKNPLQKQLQYKNLTLYNMQRVFFRLVQTQRKQVAGIKNDIRRNKYADLNQMKKQAQNKKLMAQIQLDQEPYDQLQEKQMLDAIKQIDDQIQSKMDNILQGIDSMRYNALSISQGINQIHKKIIINLNIVENNQTKLSSAQKMLDQVTPYARKPSCICNVVLFFLLALCAFLVIKIFAFPEDKGGDVPK